MLYQCFDTGNGIFSTFHIFYWTHVGGEINVKVYHVNIC